MLRIHTATSAAAVKNYFGKADYYSQGQETVGEWFGKLADRLGLSGQVTKDAFDRLCDNKHPHLDQPLTQRTNQERRIGNDMVFSGPKSFSVIEGLAGEVERRDLNRVFDAAIKETLAKEIELDVQARVRKGGSDDNRTTGNLLAAGYDHTTARPLDARTPPDPHRHRHVFVFNATFDPVEKKIKAAECGNILRDRPYYQAAFFARLAARLEGLGYAIDRRADGLWELAGVPQSVIDKFSKRTSEIESTASELGITGAAEKAELGAKTRSKKQKELIPAELRTAWDAQLSDAEREALAAVYRKEIPHSPDVTPEVAVAFAIAHCSERLSVVPERELKRVALLHGLGCVTPEQVAAELPRQGVITAAIDERTMATTAELQAEEDYIASVAARGRGMLSPLGLADGFDRKLENGRSLNDGQWAAVCGLLQSSNRVNLVEGPAGAGKSSMLGKFDEGVRRAGESVTYLATTAKAAEVLEHDGFETATLARFLVDERMQHAARGGRVVVDEASMLGHKDAVRFFKLVETLDLKPVFVGDPMQHGSVPRGAFLHVLKEYGCIRPHRLTEILRQESPAYRSAATLLSEGKTLEGFAALDALGWVKELADAGERYQQIAADYLQALTDRQSLLVVSPTHAEGARITDAIRTGLRAAGKLGEDREFTRLVPVDATVAERGQASTYRVGDVLQFHQNAKGYKKGERVSVTDPAAVPLTHAGKFSLYRPQSIPLAAGDSLRFTGTVKTLDGKHSLKNGMTKTVTEITSGGNIRLANGWIVGKDAGHFRHGFVETSFGAQGRTVQRAVLAMPAASLPAVNQEQLYVSASRARERITLYTDDKAAVLTAIQRSSRKIAALDLKAKPPQKRDRARDYWERRKRWAFQERLRSAWGAATGRGNRPQPTPPLVPRPHAERVKQPERGSSYER